MLRMRWRFAQKLFAVGRGFQARDAGVLREAGVGLERLGAWVDPDKNAGVPPWLMRGTGWVLGLVGGWFWPRLAFG